MPHNIYAERRKAAARAAAFLATLEAKCDGITQRLNELIVNATDVDIALAKALQEWAEADRAFKPGPPLRGLLPAPLWNLLLNPQRLLSPPRNPKKPQNRPAPPKTP